MHDESLYAERALRAGAKGYMTKHEASENVLRAIREVLNGEVYLNPRFMSRVMSRIMVGRDASTQPIDRLADRELEVFELIGRGLTSREIGVKLGLGITTVDTYRTRIKEKLNLENAARLRYEASRWCGSGSNSGASAHSSPNDLKARRAVSCFSLQRLSERNLVHSA